MDNNQFELIIDYDETEDHPERVFWALAEIVSEFSKFDNLVCNALSVKVNSKLSLEKIEQGSIKTTFKQIVESIDDEALANLDWKGIIGKILVKGKYKLLETLNSNSENNTADIKQLQTDLFELSKETTKNTLRANNYISSYNLAKSLEGVNTAFYKLSKKDKVKYITSTEKIETEYNSFFSLAYEKTQLIERNMVTNNRVTVIVRKPDLLGDSQWEFKYGERLIRASINDEIWLSRFQNRECIIQPKDSIECDLKIQTKDISGAKTETIYSVEKVYAVIPFEQPKQMKLDTDTK